MRGLISVLSLPAWYRLFRRLVVGPSLRRVLVDGILKVQPGERLLDVGCGPGSLLDDLPETVDYTGLDHDAKYIQSANTRHAGRNAVFIHADVNCPPSLKDRSFDIVTGIGLLHHLPDGEVMRFIELAERALTVNGRLATIDACRREGQPWLATALMRMDRGKFIRPPEKYLELVAAIFSSATLTVQTGLLRVPYSLAIVRATKNCQ